MFRMYDVQLRHAETRRGELALGFLWLPPPPFFSSIYDTMQKEDAGFIWLGHNAENAINISKEKKRKENLHWCLLLGVGVAVTT